MAASPPLPAFDPPNEALDAAFCVAAAATSIIDLLADAMAFSTFAIAPAASSAAFEVAPSAVTVSSRLASAAACVAIAIVSNSLSSGSF